MKIIKLDLTLNGIWRNCGTWSFDAVLRIAGRQFKEGLLCSFMSRGEKFIQNCVAVYGAIRTRQAHTGVCCKRKCIEEQSIAHDRERVLVCMRFDSGVPRKKTIKVYEDP